MCDDDGESVVFLDMVIVVGDAALPVAIDMRLLLRGPRFVPEVPQKRFHSPVLPAANAYRSSMRSGRLTARTAVPRALGRPHRR